MSKSNQDPSRLRSLKPSTSLLESQFSGFRQPRPREQREQPPVATVKTTTGRISPRSVLTSTATSRSSLSPSFKVRPSSSSIAATTTPAKARPLPGRIPIPTIGKSRSSDCHYDEEWPLNDESASITEAIAIAADPMTSCSVRTMEWVYDGCTDRMKHRIEAARRRQHQTGMGALHQEAMANAAQEAAPTHYFSDPGPDLYSVDGAIPDQDDDDDDATQEDMETDEPIFEMDL